MSGAPDRAIPLLGTRAFLEVAPGPDDLPDFETLAGLYLDGARALAVGPAQSPATLAEWDPAPLAGRIRAFNRLLASRDLPPLALHKASARDRTAWAHDIRDAAPSDGGRRGFLRRFAASVEESADAPEKPPLTRLLATRAETEAALFAHVPVIDPMRCTGCNACIRICPDDALHHETDAGGTSRYTTTPQDCTNCRMCVDICDASAIDIETLCPRAAPVPLRDFTCTACGVRVSEPAAQASSDTLCRICRQTGHHKKLFQVLS